MSAYRYTPEQIAAHRAAWYSYLRENPEMQGHGVLHEILPDGRERLCCLGAGCAVLAARGVRMRVVEVITHVKYDGGVKFPPSVFVEAMGLPDDDPEIEIDGERDCASAWNDCDTPWPKIADALEAAFPADPKAVRRAREAA